MRAGASSSTWIGVALASLAFAVAFLTFAWPIPAAMAMWLAGISFVVTVISFYGAYKAHYVERIPQPGLPGITAPPDLVTADSRVCWVVERGGGFVERDTTATPEELADATRAIVVSIRNDANTRTPKVRGELHYLQTPSEVVRVAHGSWLGERSNEISFAPHDSRDLLVALYKEQRFFAVDDNRYGPDIAAGCSSRALPFNDFTAWITLSVIDSNDHLISEFEERLGVRAMNDRPEVEVIGPPGAIVGMTPHSMADTKLLCDEWSASLEVTNRGEAAKYCATLAIAGPMKSMRTSDLFCQWSHTQAVESRIAKGQTCRLIIADRVPDAVGMAGFSHWVIHAIADGHAVDLPSMYHSTPFSDPPTVADDITVDVVLIADPDFLNGVERHRVVLHAFKAIRATLAPALDQ